MFDNRAALIDFCINYTDREDLRTSADVLVGLAENWINRKLRVDEMEQEQTLTTVDGIVDLPVDFQDVDGVENGQKCDLTRYSLRELRKQISDGAPLAGYAIKGRVLHTNADAEVLLRYFAKIPTLSADTDTSWFLEDAPDVYLHSLNMQIYMMARDNQQAEASGIMASSLINDLNAMYWDSRMSDRVISLRGAV